MLTNLEFLNIGCKWPPEDEEERERLELYEYNKELFKGEHEEVYRENFKRVERVIGNWQQVISYTAVLNYQKKISLKIADFLFGEVPTIKAGDENSPQQETISQIIENSELFNKSYEVAIDASMLGTGVFVVYKDETGKGIIDITQPSIWFLVVSPDNIKKTLYHVLAWTVEESGKKYLKAQIHSKGSYIENLYLLDCGIGGDTINRQIYTKTIETGLSDFAVIPVHNVMTSDRIYGYDDYTEVDSIIRELCIRIAQIARILDKHASPSMSGPISALKRSEEGEYYLEVGNYFPISDNTQAEPKYITWDGQLSAAFQQIDLLINQLYTISEMGSAIFGDIGQKTGQAVSGTALRLRMLSILAKVNRIKMRFDPAIKKAIKLCSELGGKNITNLSDEKIEILWQDGLPSDPVEEANLYNIRTGGKATISQRTALKKIEGLSEDALDEEMERIQSEESMNNPLSFPDLSNLNTQDNTDATTTA